MSQTEHLGLHVLNTDTGNPDGNMDFQDYIKEVSDSRDSNMTIIDEAVKALDETVVRKVEGKGLSSNDFTDAQVTKLAGLENYDDTELVQSITDGFDDLSQKVDGVSIQVGNVKSAVDQVGSKIDTHTSVWTQARAERLDVPVSTRASQSDVTTIRNDVESVADIIGTANPTAANMSTVMNGINLIYTTQMSGGSTDSLIYAQTLVQATTDASIDWVFRNCQDLRRVLNHAYGGGLPPQYDDDDDPSWTGFLYNSHHVLAAVLNNTNMREAVLTSSYAMDTLLDSDFAMEIVAGNQGMVTAIAANSAWMYRAGANAYFVMGAARSPYAHLLMNSAYNNATFTAAVQTACMNYLSSGRKPVAAVTTLVSSRHYHDLTANTWSTTAKPAGSRQAAVYCINKLTRLSNGASYPATLSGMDYGGNSSNLLLNETNASAVIVNKVAFGQLSITYPYMSYSWSVGSTTEGAAFLV